MACLFEIYKDTPHQKRQIHMICAYKSPETYIIHNQNFAYQITYILVNV